ncbi:nuclease-related domain-containing protein [Cellulomonas shaoxiangyii]|uniref:nuclease-related domain-containing protein n=1 Tax=Cellulomonas shaoxiangyii TaxID=2566013 RepID=UPI001AA0423B|nr:nuclease-related domain-containing protein [Cellulomonas shaoxiangyii]
MTSWIVRRWARYGHERLYAETAGGTALGYLDLKTGRFHSDDLSNLPLLEAAINDHLASRHGAASSGAIGAAPTATREPSLADVAPAWTDISGARPGSAAREQAVAARAAQGRFTGFLARVFDVRTEERAWRIGADGEEAVAAQIATLGPQWRVLHAVRVGQRNADIDHVLIGPAGVFTVNAKNHPNASVWVGGDTFIVNGQRVPYVRNSRHEAGRASRLLTEHAGFPVDVVGVIAVMGAHRGFTVKQQPRDGAVVVVARRRLSAYLQGLPARLDMRQVEAISDIARRSTTWR